MFISYVHAISFVSLVLIIMPRKSTFNASETNRLIEISSRYKNVIECKKTDAVSVKQKDEVWEKIASEFNANNEIPREAKDLQKKYKNVKYSTKSKAAEQRRLIYGTGGGPSASSAHLSTVEERMFSLLNEKEMDGIPNVADSDAVFQPLVDNVLEDEFTQEQPSPPLAPPKETPVSAAALLRTKISEPLWTGVKRSKQTSWEKLAEVKSKWSETKLQAEAALAQKEKEKVELEIKLMQEKHNMHLMQMQEMHAIEMKICNVRLEREALELKKLSEK